MKRVYFTVFLFAWSALSHAQLTNSGELHFFPGSNVAVFGDVTNNNNLVDESASFTLAGSVMQTIDGTSTITFNHLVLNNSATGVTLAQEVHVKRDLNFTDGILTTTSSDVLVFDHLSTAIGANNGSYVLGPVIKTGNEAFTFPVGRNGEYAPAGISAPLLSTDQFKTEYIMSDPGMVHSTINMDTTLHHLSACEYWVIERTSGSTDVAVTLSWDLRSCGVETLPDLRVAEWNGTMWSNKGNGGTTGNPVAGTIVTSFAQTQFSIFTLSSINALNVLPIELTNFEGHCEGRTTELNWTTASEINSDYYSIERSVDGQHWSVVGEVAAAGNSSVQSNYFMEDHFAAPGEITYYRLIQFDHGGAPHDFGIITVKGCEAEGNEQLVVYPNPSNGIFNLYFSGLSDRVNSISIYSPVGEKILETQQFENSFDLSDHPAGIYLVQLIVDGEVITERIVVQ